jgi:hypothetical protein
MSELLPAKVMVDLLREQYALALSSFEEAKRMQSETDKRLSDLYHELECAGRIDGPTGYRFAKDIQETLIARRKAKWDMSTFQLVCEFVNGTEARLANLGKLIDRQQTECERYLEEGPAAKKVKAS